MDGIRTKKWEIIYWVCYELYEWLILLIFEVWSLLRKVLNNENDKFW